MTSQSSTVSAWSPGPKASPARLGATPAPVGLGIPKMTTAAEVTMTTIRAPTTTHLHPFRELPEGACAARLDRVPRAAGASECDAWDGSASVEPAVARAGKARTHAVARTTTTKAGRPRKAFAVIESSAASRRASTGQGEECLDRAAGCIRARRGPGAAVARLCRGCRRSRPPASR